jgi:hypothetical protein
MAEQVQGHSLQVAPAASWATGAASASSAPCHTLTAWPPPRSQLPPQLQPQQPVGAWASAPPRMRPATSGAAWASMQTQGARPTGAYNLSAPGALGPMRSRSAGPCAAADRRPDESCRCKTAATAGRVHARTNGSTLGQGQLAQPLALASHRSSLRASMGDWQQRTLGEAAATRNASTSGAARAAAAAGTLGGSAANSGALTGGEACTCAPSSATQRILDYARRRRRQLSKVRCCADVAMHWLGRAVGAVGAQHQQGWVCGQKRTSDCIRWPSTAGWGSGAHTPA